MPIDYNLEMLGIIDQAIYIYQDELGMGQN